MGRFPLLSQFAVLGIARICFVEDDFSYLVVFFSKLNQQIMHNQKNKSA
jgi:hypothetical protein